MKAHTLTLAIKKDEKQLLFCEEFNILITKVPKIRTYRINTIKRELRIEKLFNWGNKDYYLTQIGISFFLDVVYISYLIERRKKPLFSKIFSLIGEYMKPDPDFECTCLPNSSKVCSYCEEYLNERYQKNIPMIGEL